MTPSPKHTYKLIVKTLLIVINSPLRYDVLDHAASGGSEFFGAQIYFLDIICLNTAFSEIHLIEV